MADPTRPGDDSPRPANDPPPARKLVFAHYMVCFFTTVEAYKREIRLAQQHGIDGFALNCGEWGHCDDANVLRPSEYVHAAERMYEAARQLDSGFLLMMSPDLAGGLKPLERNVGDMVERFHDHPNQFRRGEKVVLSAYAGQPTAYRPAIERLRERGHAVLFVPFVSAGRFEMRWSIETVLRLFRDQPHMDGLFRFACDDTPEGIMQTNANARRVTRHLDKIYMAGIAPAYESANLRDMHGMQGYAAMWESLIRDNADWVEIVTWNDYQEDSNLVPARWYGDRPAFNRDGSYLDVSAHYIHWFHTGRPPTITQDKLYFAYRDRSKWQRRAWDPAQQAWVDVSTTRWPYEQMHDDVLDQVYVTTHLVAPATLSIEIDGQRQSFEMPAGVGHAAVPMRPGVPRFVLRRADAKVLDVVGRRQIIDQPTKQNSRWLGYRLNLIWAGAAAAGVAVRLDAEAGTALGDARHETVAGRHVITTDAADGSGVTWPVRELAEATYNVRVTYRNSADEDARLTLHARGATGLTDRTTWHIPVWFPPTSGDAFATTTFFWPLEASVDALTLAWQCNRDQGVAHAIKPPEGDDVGAVQIASLELVGVQTPQPTPTTATLTPEMVDIPGGRFIMGSTDGTPDEAPTREVTVSSFAIGKYPVTNEQYERFDPTHRTARDGYSWRDREPVIYVSWHDAARYCNWLSEQAGLAPAYDESDWTLDREANGFRLPTEAEWEYVASGRGEGRRYPWGDDEPEPGVHGHFHLEPVTEVDPRLPASPAQGTTVVGSFPAGVSRDGVMDMAGNVVQWCTDTYHRYPPAAQSDPVSLEPAHHRVLRGSSWGYYGRRLHVTAREFNNAGYPGYVFVGFRVALPQTGMDIIRRQGGQAT